MFFITPYDSWVAPERRKNLPFLTDELVVVVMEDEVLELI